MRTALLLALLGMFLLPLHAEDWTTTDGKTYKNVQVIRSTPAYVTILHEDGGGQVPLSSLSPDLQKRFAYDPAKAAAFTAATAAAERRNKEALAQEKARIKAQQEQADKAIADAIALAAFSPPPDSDVGTSSDASSSSSPPDDGDYGAPAIDTEPGTQIDDWGLYGGYGYYGYGYGYYPYGFGRANSHRFNHGTSFGHGSHFNHH